MKDHQYLRTPLRLLSPPCCRLSSSAAAHRPLSYLLGQPKPPPTHPVTVRPRRQADTRLSWCRPAGRGHRKYVTINQRDVVVRVVTGVTRKMTTWQNSDRWDALPPHDCCAPTVWVQVDIFMLCTTSHTHSTRSCPFGAGTSLTSTKISQSPFYFAESRAQ